jgi:hypothetical protein
LLLQIRGNDVASLGQLGARRIDRFKQSSGLERLLARSENIGELDGAGGSVGAASGVFNQ